MLRHSCLKMHRERYLQGLEDNFLNNWSTSYDSLNDVSACCRSSNLRCVASLSYFLTCYVEHFDSLSYFAYSDNVTVNCDVCCCSYIAFYATWF